MMCNFNMFIYASRHTHKAWRPLQGVGYNFLFLPGASATYSWGWNGVTPFTVHTDVGLGIIHEKPGWYSKKHYLPNFTKQSWFSVLPKDTKCHVGTRTHTADQTSELEPGALNRYATTHHEHKLFF